jgi:hypothetical protein
MMIFTNNIANVIPSLRSGQALSAAKDLMLEC